MAAAKEVLEKHGVRSEQDVAAMEERVNKKERGVLSYFNYYNIARISQTIYWSCP